MFRKPVKTTFAEFDRIEKMVSKLPMPENMEDYVPDIEKIEKESKDREGFVIFLIWLTTIMREAGKDKEAIPANRRLRELLILDGD